jgi:pimeloyl-ACP methyl ester carboxylesterase
VISGRQREFDEQATRDLVRRDVARARDFTALQNHESIPDGDRRRCPLSSISVPTLVIHGSADPMLPFAHGEALAETIPDAELLRLEGAGHGVDRADWEPIAKAIVEHTEPASS